MKEQNLKSFLLDPYLLLSIGSFLVLFLPFLGTIPYLDGNIDFVKGYDFFSGGFSKLFQNWASVHPPGKELIALAFFKLFGVNRYSYTLISPLFGVLGIILIYLLTSRIFGKIPGRISTFLLAINPLFLSVGIFSLTDYLLTIFVIGSFYFYLREKIFPFVIFLTLSFLTKESGLLVPLSIILIELLTIKETVSKKRSFPLNAWLALIFPFLIVYFWFNFLKINGKPLWSDWNFSETAKQGSLYTIVNNLTTFSFFNKYAYENWLHLFVLNFNWLYWSILIVGTFLLLKKNLLKKPFTMFLNTSSGKTLLSIILFCTLYSLTVLSFQTYPIPRYVLPITPFIFLGVAKSLQEIQKSLKITWSLFLIPLLPVIGMSLFLSLDPISSTLWNKETVLGQEIYAMRKKLAGNDGITYNMQYALIAKKRTQQILAAKIKGQIVYSENCFWIYPDPRNDSKTNQVLKLNINFEKPCLNTDF